ncbi:hypothetical protein [Rufibacter latericius]|uniref:Uncharacterized protein n=1 Tax=Rufibacter latericius TaxID=2487040 RepID=A0A3M9MK95_9BACT|nr:hypothetical protein [Rufibacter latericius]RNI25916.1 hypothetical protein EFB08_13835 [Rufibacter latericius]
MNFDFAEQINPFLEVHAYSNAIELAETALQKITFTDFHAVLGQSLVHQSGALTVWMDEFYANVSKEIAVKAMYFEMNEFDINTDYWYIDGFAFIEDGGWDLEDMEWLSEASEETMTSGEFILKGYEQLQEAFENEDSDSAEAENARDWCEQIVIARFMELMRTAHLKAKDQNLEWADIPLYYSIHGYDFILRSEG